tara:strand:+ start:1429 stop:2358 length:930 start_codon:yes stop_codon:yes gene_type:complete
MENTPSDIKSSKNNNNNNNIPKFNEAEVTPTGFQEYGQNLFGIDTNPYTIGAVVLILIIFIVTFDYLGVSYDESSKSYVPLNTGIGNLEVLMWGLLIFLVMINGMQYYMGVNIKTAINQLFSPTPGIDIALGKDADKLIGLKEEEEAPPPPEEVFHVGKNIYNYEEAKAVCKAYNSELASYDQIENAYMKGAEWCSYGWSKDQLALFPTQKVTWNKIKNKQGACDNNGNDCGRPGINGGFIDNPMVRFGVNCYGMKPDATDADNEKIAKMQLLPKSKEEEELECKASKMKKKLKSMDLRPFNKQKWKEM